MSDPVKVNWSFFDPQTGLFTGQRFSGTERHLAANLPNGLDVIEGTHDHLSRRVDLARFRAERDAALEMHRRDVVEVARAAFKPMNGQSLADFREPPFKFPADSRYVIDWQPPAPSADHEWNASTRRWSLRADVVERQAQRATALAMIGALEARGVRAMRELALGQDGARERLQAIEEQIAELRVKL